MKTNTSEAQKSLENKKRGTKGGRFSAPPIPFPAPAGRPIETARLAKSSVEYWKERVRQRTWKDGTKTPELYLRLKEGSSAKAGRDAWVCLNTANRATAATKARDLWLIVQSKGLDAALAEFRPKAAPRPARVCTVAEYLAAAKPLADVRPQTLAEYEASLRRVVAGVRGIISKSDRHAVRAEWHAKVNMVRIDQVTPSAVRTWMKAEVAAVAAKGEAAKDRRAHTLASHIRDARALFAENIVAELRKSLVLPAELPFAGITTTSTTRRFVCAIDARELYAAAAALDSDTRTAFDLLLCAGLRRGEADALPWAHVDLKAGTVRVDVTEFFRPKSRESFRTVPLPPDMVKRLNARRAAKPLDAFVLDGAAPKIASARGYTYRAHAWDKLTAWLRTQGLHDYTPLHALRKMSGSFIYAVAGLEAARRHLGHRDISTTAASYLQSGAATVNLAAPTP